MNNIGDLVYVFLNDLNQSLPITKKLNKNRFGRIKEIKDVNINKNNISQEYIIKLFNEKEIIVKKYLSGFDYLDLVDLQKLILAANYLTDEEKDNLINEVKEIIKDGRE